jgi:hypothetical protein
VALGARILSPIKDQFYGDRSGSIADPFEQPGLSPPIKKICLRNRSSRGLLLLFAVHKCAYLGVS